MQRLRYELRGSLLGIGLLVPGSMASASTLTLSDFSSDSTPASALSATLDFHVSGDTLTLVVTNLTNGSGGGEYEINRIYFNATSNVADLALLSPKSTVEPDDRHKKKRTRGGWYPRKREWHQGNGHGWKSVWRDDDDHGWKRGWGHGSGWRHADDDGWNGGWRHGHGWKHRDDEDDDDDDEDDNGRKGGWTLERDRKGAGEFGTFDFALIGGVGRSPDQIDAGDSLEFVFSIEGDGPFSMFDFTSELSTIPPGTTPSTASAKFVQGPKDDSAYGATDEVVVPEPATSLLFAGGLLAAGRRLRRASHR